MNENIQPTFLIAATTWWALSARLARALLQHGCIVEALCPPGHPLRYVKGVRAYHLYSRLNSIGSLSKAIATTNPELVIPCDDGVVRQLHELYHKRPELRVLIARSLGNPAHFEVAGSRERLQEIALELKIRVPRSNRVNCIEDLRAWFTQMEFPAVLKQDGTWGGSGVRVVHSTTEAAYELTRLLRPSPWGQVCKRMVVDRDPLALWSKRNGNPVVNVQEFISGQPANLMMACWQGQVLGTVAVSVLWSQGPTGAAMVVRLINQAEMTRAAHRLAKRLDLSGFYGLDFVLEARSGAAHLIEMNPRCTQLGHLEISGKGSLAGLLCRRLGATSPNRLGMIKPVALDVGDTIAFFPKAFARQSADVCLGEAYKDLPEEDPELMQQLLKPEWPDRQWPARIYHRLRPRNPQAPATFNEISNAESRHPVLCMENTDTSGRKDW